MTNTLFSLGHGYTARALARLLLPRGWTIIGTTRDARKAAELRAEGIEPLLWPDSPLQPSLSRATHLLTSIAPDASGDPVLSAHGDEIAAARHLRWVGYLSTTGVYGDHLGGWVDETSPLEPTTRRGRARVEAETAWSDVCERAGLALHIFRLAGIYGPGRGPFEKVRNGVARRIVKPGQVFSRIHVEDIAQVLAASIAQPAPGAIYNVCDDEPAPPEDVIAHAARLLGRPLPPEVDFESADLSPMARSFYSENKRVRNDRIRKDLGVVLKYPNYRLGLAALREQES